MAVVANTLIGRSRKAVGNAVFSRWKNLNILKEKGNPHNPQTDNQMQFRARFSILVHLSSLLQGMIRIGFKQYRQVMTEFNKFVSENSKNGFLVWNSGTFTWDVVAAQLAISKGSLQQTNFTVTTGVTNGDTNIQFDYSAVAIANQSVDDQVAVLIIQYSGTGDNAGTLFPTSAVTRADGTVTVPLESAAITGQVFGVYMFFMRADGTIVSNNTYLSLTVA